MIIISIIINIIIVTIGLFAGYLIGTKLLQNQIYVYHGPDSNHIKKKIFYDPKTEKYYRFIPKPYICPPMYKKYLKANSLKLTNSLNKLSPTQQE